MKSSRRQMLTALGGGAFAALAASRGIDTAVAAVDPGADGVLNAKTDYGANPTPGVDNTAALNAFFTDVNGGIGIIPPGKYEASDVHCPNIESMIFAEGAQLKPASGANGLTFGDPAKTNGVVAGGLLQGLTVSRDTSTPPTPRIGNAGIRLARASQVTVDRCTVWGGFDIGFDLVSNCYGAELRNCRSTFGGNNVGLNLRQGSESGSDLYFENCWLDGDLAAVWADGGGGGYHFIAGQLGAGYHQTGPRDDLGVLMIGTDYLSGVHHDGCANLSFLGTSWEGWHWMWALRALGAWSASFKDANFNATGGSAQGCRGLLKADSLEDTKLHFSNCSLGGAFTNASGKLMELAGQFNGKFGLVDELWKATNQALSVNGGAAIDIGRTASVALIDNWTQGASAITPNGIYYAGTKLT